MNEGARADELCRKNPPQLQSGCLVCKLRRAEVELINQTLQHDALNHLDSIGAIEQIRQLKGKNRRQSVPFREAAFFFHIEKCEHHGARSPRVPFLDASSLLRPIALGQLLHEFVDPLLLLRVLLRVHHLLSVSCKGDRVDIRLLEGERLTITFERLVPLALTLVGEALIGRPLDVERVDGDSFIKQLARGFIVAVPGVKPSQLVLRLGLLVWRRLFLAHGFLVFGLGFAGFVLSGQNVALDHVGVFSIRCFLLDLGGQLHRLVAVSLSSVSGRQALFAQDFPLTASLGQILEDLHGLVHQTRPKGGMAFNGLGIKVLGILLCHLFADGHGNACFLALELSFRHADQNDLRRLSSPLDEIQHLEVRSDDAHRREDGLGIVETAHVAIIEKNRHGMSRDLGELLRFVL